MTRIEFYALFEETLELDPGSVRGDFAFRGLPGWDSMMVLNVIALMDEHFGVSVSSKDMARCTSIDDLANLAGEQIQ